MKNDLDKGAISSLLSYDARTGHFCWKIPAWRRAVGERAGHLRADGYRVLRILVGKRRVAIFEHRAAWIMHYGVPPKKEIDHINRDRADNRIANLREATRADNARHRRPIRGAELKGVHYEKGATCSKKWRAYISIASKRINLGRYLTKDEALEAYKRAALELHGDFATWQ